MFTGIIEQIGIVKNLSKGLDGSSRINLKTSFKDNKISVGESIAVDGTCLTVVYIKNGELEFDVSEETLTRTTLKYIKTGMEVNLERAMKADGRWEGHIVQGHIDCIAHVIKIITKGQMKEVTFELPSKKNIYIVKKGSIAVNGVSLTVNSVSDNSFSVMLVPLTLQETNLSKIKSGSIVNIEFDIIGKYIEKFVKNQKKIINENFLEEHGF